ncbi:MAG: LPS-assembly protein LptD [Acidobacteria bacterium]|nr:MAG: LPS-assembly protein LptD [Acidobacteriota bacterium]
MIRGRPRAAWRRIARLALAAGLLAGLLAPAARAQQALSGLGLEDAEVRFERSRRDGDLVVFEGGVEFQSGDARILADVVTWNPATRIAVAEGDVVLSFPGAVLTGRRLRYDVEHQTGEIEHVTGYFAENGAVMRARRAERVGPKRIRVEDAQFTTCTQPVPYWSFRIHRGTFDLGAYAYLRGVGFKAQNMPVFYTPYLVWPIKTGRASGLLFPEFNNSDKLGASISLPLYWAFSDHADLTLFFEGFTRVGFGLGAELNWLPTPRGWAEGRMRWIDDRVRRRSRYRYEWRQRQESLLGFDLRANVDVVSDFDYFTDYETDLLLASSPRTDSRVTLTREWSWYTFSIDARRQEQFFVGGTAGASVLTGRVVNQKLPDLELRGRSRRLGRLPVYLSFVTSVSRFTRRIEEPPAGQFSVLRDEELVTAADNSWQRFDLAPRLSLPLVQQAWGDLTLSFGWRGTWYSARQDPADSERLVGTSLWRSLFDAGVQFSGPRFQRVYLTPDWSYSPKLKHVIEPFVNYTYRPRSSIDPAEVIRTDEVDNVPGALSDFTYGIRQRFYVLRRPETGGASSLLAGRKTSFDEIEREQERAQADDAREGRSEGSASELPVAETLNPTELGSLEIFQTYSLVREGLTRDVARLVDAAGQPLVDPVTGRPQTVLLGLRSYSPVTVRARLNPTADHSVDAAWVWDPANNVLTETRVSTLMRLGGGSYFEGSWFRRRPSDPALSDPSSFVRSRFGVSSRSRRFSLETELDYDIETSDLQHQGYLVRLASQCCTLKLGYDRRDFSGNSREEFYLVVDLAGIGEVLDLKKSLTD